MNFENQGVIKRLADQYGPENLAVVLGNGEASGVEVFAETVTEGDPSYAGPLAGVFKIPSITCRKEVSTPPESCGRKLIIRLVINQPVQALRASGNSEAVQGSTFKVQGCPENT
jgi:hypothetical protein